jgi:hypothetical protein
MNEKKYEEVGHNYRYFLGWRHACVAGDLVILYGVATLYLTARKEAPGLAWLVPFVASPIGLLFWWIDKRNQDLIHAVQRTGKELEGPSGGVYSTLVDELAVPKGKSAYSRWTLTGATNIVFLGSSGGLLLWAVAALCRTCCRGT